MTQKKPDVPVITLGNTQIKVFHIPVEKLARVGREVCEIAEARRRAREIPTELFTLPIGPGHK
jgi:hypothetical protein